MSALQTVIWGQDYGVRANWAHAADTVERLTEDGWEATGDQVADYQHDPHRALRSELEVTVMHGGENPHDATISAEIDAAVKAATWTEDE